MLPNIWATFSRRNSHQELSKIAKSGHTALNSLAFQTSFVLLLQHFGIPFVQSEAIQVMLPSDDNKSGQTFENDFNVGSTYLGLRLLNVTFLKLLFPRLPWNLGDLSISMLRNLSDIGLTKIAYLRAGFLPRPAHAHDNKIWRSENDHFKKMGHSRPLFLYFRLFNTVDSK